ncbi:MAG: hypothetical protein ABSF35_17550 [Polyangia bacterium]|jgi:hypothetical protein
MSKPRTPSFGREQRSRLAKRAATARWARLGRGVLTLAEIRAAVVKALADREAKLAPGGAGIPRGLGFLPATPAPGGSEAKSPGEPAEAPGPRRAAVMKALAERDTKVAAGILPGLPSMPEPPAPGGSDPEAPGKHKRKRKPRAFVFDSYGRGDATARDEIYILIVLEEMPEDWAGETTYLTSAIGHALGDDHKEIVLYLSDAATYREWKGAWGTAHHAAATEGIRLV